MMKVPKPILILVLALVLSGELCYSQNYIIPKVHPASTRNNNEECPVLIGNQLIFLSNRATNSIVKYYDQKEQNYYHMYYTDLDTSNNNWSEVRSFSPELATNFSDGPVSLDSSAALMAFSRSLSAGAQGTFKSSTYNGIFFATKNGDTWGNITSYPYNVPDAQTTHPSLSKNGDVLYFSSDRAGGFGGYDLYISTREKGRWTQPRNLGPRVNTNENDFYPFIHPSGRLYFSSMGHDNSLAGYDIFYTEIFNGSWADPVILPPPVNGSFKELSYQVDDNFEKGFFTSNRRGSYDIWTFTSTLPSFEICQEQRRDNFCFIFFEENTVELDTSLYAYEWNLGDGIRIRDVQAKHCFQSAGKYTVNLNVIDKLTKDVLFNQASYDFTVERIEQPYNDSPDTISANRDIQFSGKQSYFKTTTPGEYYWDFGDGTRGVGATFRHTYKIPGNYTVKLGMISQPPEGMDPSKFCSYRVIKVNE